MNIMKLKTYRCITFSLPPQYRPALDEIAKHYGLEGGRSELLRILLDQFFVAANFPEELKALIPQPKGANESALKTLIGPTLKEVKA